MADKKNILDRFRLDGRVALVTGAAMGIGQGYAEALGQAGARVALVDINREAADATCAALQADGIEAMVVIADVTKPDQVKRMVQEVVDRWGRLDIGVNNAGIAHWHDSETLDYADWNRVIDLDFNAVFLCCQAEAQVMLKAGYGKIINTASMSGHIVNTPQNQTAYNAAKAGVIHLTRSLAAEWASRGVRVNSISPGYTLTAMVEHFIRTPEGQAIEKKWLSLTPMGRMGLVSDLQGAVVYLASEASDFMTGHDMIIDGGYCCW
jgi:sorbose reductase